MKALSTNFFDKFFCFYCHKFVKNKLKFFKMHYFLIFVHKPVFRLQLTDPL